MTRKTLQRDQRGVVSFMVTLIMMLVISLIVIGFTQVTIRSRREALDKQLSSQAFYAAESGINDVVAKISGLAIIPVQTTCDEGKYNGFSLNASPDVAVTCLLVNDNPENIIVGATQNKSSVVLVNPTDSNGNNATISNLSFTWSVDEGLDTNVANCQTSANIFETAENDCNYALLRVDLMQWQNDNVSGTPPADVLNNQTATLFLQPRSNGSGLATLTDANTKGLVVAGKCTASTESCTADITLNGQFQGKKYYARLSTLYHESPQVIIDAKMTNSSDAHFKGTQVMIDSTGRAQDVLRRVQVRYPLSRSDDTPPWAAAGQVCKKFTVVPTENKVDVAVCTP